jgi:hypothetical protein
VVIAPSHSEKLPVLDFAARPEWGDLFRWSVETLKSHCSYSEIWAPDCHVTESRHLKRNLGIFCNGLVDAGLADECAHLLELVMLNQWENGFLGLEPGCWDLNGQFIFAVYRLFETAPDHPALAELYSAVSKAARWIVRKRHEISHDHRRPRGVLPAGWRADDMGGLEYQWWDDFWGYAGLKYARVLSTRMNAPADSEFLLKHAEEFRSDILNATNRAIEFDPNGILPAFLLRHSDDTSALNGVVHWPLRIADLTRAHSPLESTGNFSGRATIQPWLEIIRLGAALGTYSSEVTSLRIDSIARLAGVCGSFPQAFAVGQTSGCGFHGYDIIASSLWVSLLHDQICVAHIETESLELFPSSLQSLLDVTGRITVKNLPCSFGKFSLQAYAEGGRAIMEFSPAWKRPPVHVFVNDKNGSRIDMPASGRLEFR